MYGWLSLLSSRWLASQGLALRITQRYSNYGVFLMLLHRDTTQSTIVTFQSSTKIWALDIGFLSLCAFCREVVPTKPFTNTALYYKMMLESEPTPLATKWFGGFYGGSKANVGHYKMTLRNHFVVKTGGNEKSWFTTKWVIACTRRNSHGFLLMLYIRPWEHYHFVAMKCPGSMTIAIVGCKIGLDVPLVV